MATPLKGILKKPADGGNAATHSRRQRTEQDNEEIARKHAAILQERKDYEAAVFQAIERLTDFPLERGPAFSAAHPAPADAAAFTQLVRIFQPGDYDDLIEERNTCGLCGYSLCARPRQTFAGRGTWKLVNAGRRDFGIVAKGELEKWCSAACARRALYIKVQLNETAAWERVGIPDIQVELLEEDEEKKKNETKQKAQDKVETLTKDLARLKLQQERKLAENQKSLALERGDVSSASAAADEADESSARKHTIQPTTALVDVDVVEKRVITVPQPPSLDSSAAGDAHLVLEGHKTKFVR